MMMGMGWGMAIIGLLIVVFLTLGIVAFAKYLTSPKSEPPK
jgi:hypothetical protein